MLRTMLEQNFDVDIDRVMFVEEALEKMHAARYDLVLVNRLIFEDGSDGSDLLRKAKADPSIASTPIMMISNYANAQAASRALGGQPGFGKMPRRRAVPVDGSTFKSR